MDTSKKVYISVGFLFIVSLILLFYLHSGDRQVIPSENEPYYLEVQKYRFILDAKGAKKSLEKMGLPSFYTPYVESKTGRWILVGIGPDKDIERIEKLQEKARDEGIYTIVKNFIEEKDKFVTDRTLNKQILKEMYNWYNKLELKEKAEIPELLSVIPYVSGFSIDVMVYGNNKNITDKRLSWLLNYPREFLSYVDKIEEFAHFLFINWLKKESIVFYGAKLKEEVGLDGGEKYRSKLGALMCTKSESWISCGKGGFYFKVIGSKEDTLLKFVNAIGSGFNKDPYAYNLFLSSFPVGMEVNLCIFKIDYIGESYVISKNNAEWAQKMRGYWTSVAYFFMNNENLQIQLFDLETEDYTDSVYKIYSKEKYRLRGSYLYDFMKILNVYTVPVKVRDNEGWYVDLAAIGGGKEISFTSDEYIVAVGTDPSLGKFMMRADLEKIARNLNIFERP